jgi:hypothetical protein
MNFLKHIIAMFAIKCEENKKKLKIICIQNRNKWFQVQRTLVF